MWIARDLDRTTMVYENKPILAESSWFIESGYYFEVPDYLILDILGRQLKLEETIEIEIKVK